MQKMKAVVRFLCCLSLLAPPFLAASDSYVVPGDNLLLEGIPKIPTALADELNRYTEFRSASFSSWHPSKREMLILTRFADTPQVHAVTFPGGARPQLTF